MKRKPLMLVLSAVLAVLAAPVGAVNSGGGQCHLTPYELGPKGLKTAQTPIASCDDIQKLSPEDQQLFAQTRKAINDLPNNAKAIPPVLKQGERFLTKGELYFIRAIEASNQLADGDS